jgi:hypothetical protein
LQSINASNRNLAKPKESRVERDLRRRWQIEVCSFGAFPDIAFRHGESPIEAATDAKQWPRSPENDTVPDRHAQEIVRSVDPAM